MQPTPIAKYQNICRCLVRPIPRSTSVRRMPLSACRMTAPSSAISPSLKNGARNCAMAASKLAGSRSYFLVGDGTLLHQAVLRLAQDMMIERGFMPMTVPVLPFLGIMTIAGIANLLAVAGLGTREATLLFFFPRYGIASTLTVAFSLSIFALTITAHVPPPCAMLTTLPGDARTSIATP